MSKKRAKQPRQEIANKNHLQLRDIVPLTENQARTFDAYESGSHLFLHGFAGTGKSFISSYLALVDVTIHALYEKVVFIRSVVPSREIGFLPGSMKDKIRVYEEPYVEIVNDLYNRGDAYKMLETKGVIQFTTTSFLRGLTFRDSIVIVDEAQNMTFAELDTVMTRMGPNSKIIFCGDFRQTDFINDREKSGLLKFINITKRLNKFEYIEFEKNDIVRSGLVKDYIIARTEMESFL